MSNRKAGRKPVNGPGRTPPLAVKRILRREVGYGCPVEGCGSPYLQFHHFDPTWAERHHHEPGGMIAICAAHHAMADAYTREQIRHMKSSPYAVGSNVRGRFEWRRQRLVARVGGNFYVDTPVPVGVSIGSEIRPLIWLTRDEQDGVLLLSLRMLTTSGEPRLVMDEHEWISRGTPADFEAPPSGKRLSAKYSNGDSLDIEFLSVGSLARFESRFPNTPAGAAASLEYPVTVVEIGMVVAGADISFTQEQTLIRTNSISNSWIEGGQFGLVF